MRFSAVLFASASLSLLAAPVAAGVNRWTPIGPETASVCDFAAAPSRPGTIYAGLTLGGVYRSVDGGATWAAARGRLPLQGPICDLAVDPASPGTVYAGTDGGGVWKTVDGGTTWERINQGIPRLGPVFASVSALAADPRASGTVYAIASRALFKTTNGGRRWIQMMSGLPRAPHHLAIDPGRPAILYMISSTSSRVFKSTNGGATWTSFNAGLPADAVLVDLEIDPRTPSTLYVSAPRHGVFKSVDGGRSWSPENTGLPPATVPSLLFSDLALVSARRQQTLYVATLNGDFYRSADGGGKWSVAGSLPAGSLLTLEAGSGGALLAGASGPGAFRSLDRGTSWISSSRGLTAGNVSSVVPDSTSGLYAGGGELHLNSDGIWSKVRFPETAEGTGRFTGGITFASGITYVSTDAGIYRSSNGAIGWSFAGSLGCDVAYTLRVNPRVPTTVYAGASPTAQCQEPDPCNPWKSVDGGGSWACINDGLPEPGSLVSGVDPFALDHLYSLYEGVVVYHSTDDGETWSELSTLDEFAAGLAFDHAVPGRVYAGQIGGIARSDDGGRTWTEIGQGLPEESLLPLLIDPASSNILYAATSLRGVFKSTDSGVTWTPLGPGLEGLVVNDIALDPRNLNILYAATNGGGVMKITQRQR